MKKILKTALCLLLAFAATGCDNEEETTGRLKVVSVSSEQQTFTIYTDKTGAEQEVCEKERVTDGFSIRLETGTYRVARNKNGGSLVVQIRPGRTTIARFGTGNDGVEYE